MKLLNNKVAIVTGASSGIGRATARLFATEGASVVVTARRQAELETLVSEIQAAGGIATAVAGDVRDDSVAKLVADTATERFGGLDIAFNNAGAIGAMGPTSQLTPADWDATIGTNLTGTFLGVRHQVPAMMARGGGSLIFTGSFVGYTVGMPGMAAYAAGKAGLIGLMKTLAVELGPHGIRANAVLPGGTDTPSSVTNTPDAGPEVLAFVQNLHALKRLAHPDEIARSVLHLASDASSFITGTALLVDGGVSIARS